MVAYWSQIIPSEYVNILVAIVVNSKQTHTKTIYFFECTAAVSACKLDCLMEM